VQCASLFCLAFNVALNSTKGHETVDGVALTTLPFSVASQAPLAAADYIKSHG
jgi:hypothetical protein